MIPPREAVGNGREAYIETIPDHLQDKICKCKNYYRNNSSPVHNYKYIKLPDSGPVGILVHQVCGKPTNLWSYIEECYNCEELYVVTKFPDNNLICGDCN